MLSIPLTTHLLRWLREPWNTSQRLGESVARTSAHVYNTSTSESSREALLADERTGLVAEELDALLDPTGYLGAAEALVDRALGEYERDRG